MKICIIGSHQKGHDETCRVIRHFVKNGWEILSPRLEKKHEDGLTLTLPAKLSLMDLKKAFNQADALYIAYSGDLLEPETLEEIRIAAATNKPLYASMLLPVKYIAERVNRICQPEDVIRLLAIQTTS